MKRLWVASLFLVGCGSVPVLQDAATGDGSASDSMGGHDSEPSCGAAGQPCCGVSGCATGLTCSTTSDLICRAGEVWVGGTNVNANDAAVILHGSGTSFTVDMLGNGIVSSIYGTSSSDVWALITSSFASSGQTTTFRHWNGTAWSNGTTLGGYYYALWGSAPDNYWAVNNSGQGIHWNGTAWSNPQPIAPNAVLVQLWGSSATDVWALGNGAVSHWDGSANWSPTMRNDFNASARNAISGRANGEWFSGGALPNGGPAILHRNGTTFTVEPAAGCGETHGVWANATDAWAVASPLIPTSSCSGQAAVSHLEGAAWVDKGMIPGATGSTALWGTSNRDLYVLGPSANGPTVFHHDGSSWAAAFTATTTQASALISIWGTGN